jgi:hypothetical protein
MQEWGERGEAERKAFLAYLNGEQQTHAHTWQFWILIITVGALEVVQIWALLQFLFA